MSDLHHKNYLNRIDSHLSDLIQQTFIPSAEIKDAINYSLFPGGKRLRPLLVYYAGEITKAPIQSLDYIASAIEMTHCYSLIHDDLPAMDNDDMRRGKLSCHKFFSESTAILTGDALQALAIEVLLKYLPNYLNATKVIEVSKVLLNASGPSGMVSGQALDLSKLSLKNVSESEIIAIHRLKTSYLIQACIQMSIIAGEPSEDEQQQLEVFANHFGLLYQMQDDYMDKYQSEKLKKGRSSDLQNDKTTYATIMSESELYQKILMHFEKAQMALKNLGCKSQNLFSLLNYFHQYLTTSETS